MKPKEIQELLHFIAESGLEEVIVETENFKLKTRRSAADHKSAMAVPQMISQTPQMITSNPLVAVVPPVTATATKTETTEVIAEKPATSGGRVVAIKSPMIGTFYRSASPTSPVFVNVGDEVRKGQVVCIIEAMKLFNEIESELEGKIVKVLIDNASPVEYDQDLFLIEVK